MFSEPNQARGTSDIMLGLFFVILQCYKNDVTLLTKPEPKETKKRWDCDVAMVSHTWLGLQLPRT